MKFLRLLLTLLALVAALAAVLLLLAIAPPVQTWLAQRVIANRPGMTASLGSLSAGFGRVDVGDLHLESGGAVLTLPSLQAGVPLTEAIFQRRAIVRSLVAKGWTLDLSRAPEAADGNAPAPSPAVEQAPAQRAAKAFLGFLAGWRPPCDFSLDGVDLEGEVLLAPREGLAPVRVHVTLTGSGVTSAKGGELTFDAESDNPGFSADSVEAHGRLTVEMEPSGAVRRLEVNADLLAKGGSLPEDIALTARAAVVRGATGESYTLELSRGSRLLAEIVAGFAGATGRLEGTWKVDLRDSDVAPFSLGHPLPSFTAKGDGRYDADAGFARFHVVGQLKASASRLSVVAAPLGRLGAVEVGADFDLAHEGRTMRVGRLELKFGQPRTPGAPGPEAEVSSRQPFVLDEKSGELKVADPSAELMWLRFTGLPLAWLPRLPGGVSFDAGAAAGEFAVRSEGGTFAVRPRKPLTAQGVAIRNDAGRGVRDLDLSVSPSADFNAQGWQLQWPALAVSGGGRQLATIEGKATLPAGADQPATIAGSWKADLEALGKLPSSGGAALPAGRSASGDFTASVAASTSLDAKFAVAGRDPGHSVSASVHADFDPYGGFTFSGPVKIALGASVAEVATEGSWSRDDSVTRVDVSLISERVDLGHLRILSAALAAAGGMPLPGRHPGPDAAAPRDKAPFWGNLVGSVKYSFARLETGGQGLDYVGGVFEIGPGSIQLAGGHATLPHQNMVRAEGTLAFSASSEAPYSLRATAAAKGIDEATLFPAPAHGENPPLEGKFSATATITGSGANLDDLAARTQGEIHLASDGGILRLLKTTVAEAIPETSAPVSDTVGTVGSAVGAILGVQGGSRDAGKNTVSKGADAVISFTYAIAEIGYDQLNLTASQGADHSIRLTGIEMTSPELRLRGTGQIAFAEGLPVSRRPLTMELSFGARGDNAKLLATAGLLSPGPDDQGYTMLLGQPVHFGGTLAQIDLSEWHDLLVKAATRRPEAAKPAAKPGP